MPGFEAITGRYLWLEVSGTRYRVYIEQAGDGIPLVCQHTAGADTRQWRHLMNDPDVTRRFRVIAADLPFHGKSVPPEDVEWWKQEYRLTKAFLLAFHAALCSALELDAPVYLGCSVGGHLAPDLALERPELYSAVIGVQSGLGFAPELSAAMQPHLEYLHHPRIGNDFKGASMRGLCGPHSPEPSVRETTYVYSSNAPAVFKGDLYYYFNDHTLTAADAARIDTRRVAVYFLTGEYDPTTSPAETRLLADAVAGSHFTPMKGMGHFGMSEDYANFHHYLLPVLDDIAQKRRAARG